MGATTFETRGKGKTAEAAFKALREEALHMYGHGGYTGTIAEKDRFVEVTIPKAIRDDAQAFSAKIDHLLDTEFDDKWGPAGCVKLKEGEYLFFGWASE